MAENYKKLKSNIRVTKILFVIAVFFTCFISVGCSFSKDKIHYIVNNSDVEFYKIGKIEITSYESTVKLNDGRVLITGGLVLFKGKTNKTYIYNPKTGKITNGPYMCRERYGHSSILLPDGRIFIYGGGWDENKTARITTEFYYPDSNTFVLGPDLIENIYHKDFPSSQTYFLDDKKEYLYIFTYRYTNLLDLKNDKIYAIDPIRPDGHANGQTIGTDTIMGFENKALEKEFVNKIKKLPPYNNNLKFDGEIVHYKDDLYYLIGVRNNYKNKTTISLYNAKTKEEKEINTKTNHYYSGLKLNNNKVLLLGSDDINIYKKIYAVFDMKTQKIKSLNFNESYISNPVVLDDGSIFWTGVGSGVVTDHEKGNLYILKIKEGVL